MIMIRLTMLMRMLMTTTMPTTAIKKASLATTVARAPGIVKSLNNSNDDDSNNNDNNDNDNDNDSTDNADNLPWGFYNPPHNPFFF